MVYHSLNRPVPTPTNRQLGIGFAIYRANSETERWRGKKTKIKQHKI